MKYKVAYNACHGGFSLSEEASIYLNEHWDMNIDPKYGYIDERVIPRHHKGLIEVIELLGDRANRRYSELLIAEIDSNSYRIDEYDGFESVETPDSYDWVIINE